VDIDSDAMLEIIEQTEGTRYLGAMMRSRMLDRLREMGNPEQELKALFEEIDDNNSNLLSRREFQIFLEALGISRARNGCTERRVLLARSALPFPACSSWHCCWQCCWYCRWYCCCFWCLC
jgi:hypothetical protein